MSRLNDLSIKAKLSAGFGLSLALIFVIGGISLVQLRVLNTLATQVTENWLPEMEIIGKTKRAMEEYQLLAMRRIDVSNFRQIAADAAKMRAIQDEVVEGVRAYTALAERSEERDLLDRFVDQWAAYRRSLGVAFGRLEAGDPDAARRELDTTTAAAYRRAAKTIDDLLDNSRSEGVSATQGVRSVYGLSLGIIVAVLLFAAASVMTAIYWISANVSRPILRISEAMRRLSAGDNSIAQLAGGERKDEIGVLVNAVSNYRGSLDRIRELADEANVERARFDAALTNMSQGLCMFDSNGKLVIFNPRFTEIFGIPPDKIEPGMTTPDLMTLTFEYSKVRDVNPEATLAQQRKFIREGIAGTTMVQLTDGRTISVSHRPMPAGGFVATFEDITERLFAEERIRHLAHFDALTDLPNRVTFYERMDSILAHLRRSESVAVLSLDLDRFKGVNDMLGHPVGDLLLKAVADRIRGCIRDEDIAARLGGDEFAVVQVLSKDAPDVSALAARLIEVVGASYELDGHQVVVSISVGIAIAPADGDGPDVLMKNADLALYRAKADGGGTYRFFEMEMDARMQARRALELDLRRAVVNCEFELYYQPIISVKTGQVTGCEALVRWHNPEHGMISPGEFIPVAEETGLIVQIGEWVLREACAEAARWPSHVIVAVNVSPAQFKNRNLVQTVIRALADSGLSPDRLELEITELVLLQESEGAFSILHELRDLGIKIAMDDFGTGYSSLGYLRSFPFDKIKIDQSFIRDLPSKEGSVAIVRAVVGLSSSLGITTTAEGVETSEQLARLTSEGCNEVQDFLFSPPRPAAEVEHILAEMAGKTDAVA